MAVKLTFCRSREYSTILKSPHKNSTLSIRSIKGNETQEQWKQLIQFQRTAFVAGGEKLVESKTLVFPFNKIKNRIEIKILTNSKGLPTKSICLTICSNYSHTPIHCYSNTATVSAWDAVACPDLPLNHNLLRGQLLSPWATVTLRSQNPSIHHLTHWYCGHKTVLLVVPECMMCLGVNAPPNRSITSTQVKKDVNVEVNQYSRPSAPAALELGEPFSTSSGSIKVNPVSLPACSSMRGVRLNPQPSKMKAEPREGAWDLRRGK